MKNIILVGFITLSFHLAGFNSCKASGMIDNTNNGNEPVVTPSSINNLDSVYFNISQAIFNGNSVEFPISFKSDDVINALGFAFTFDETVLQYDTIIVLAPYFDSPIFSYNPIDSVVRFEAFSISQPMVNDTVLVKVRFNLLSTQLCDTQIDSIWSSLNGDVCSHIVQGCQTLGMEDLNFDSNIKIFPNPANEIIYIDAHDVKQVELFDVNGKMQMKKIITDSVNTIHLPVAGLDTGIYFIKLFSEKAVSIRKIVLTN